MLAKVVRLTHILHCKFDAHILCYIRLWGSLTLPYCEAHSTVVSLTVHAKVVRLTHILRVWGLLTLELPLWGLLTVMLARGWGAHSHLNYHCEAHSHWVTTVRLTHIYILRVWGSLTLSYHCDAHSQLCKLQVVRLTLTWAITQVWKAYCE